MAVESKVKKAPVAIMATGAFLLGIFWQGMRSISRQHIMQSLGKAEATQGEVLGAGYKKMVPASG
ncbi:hypothetical protein ApDm4_2460 [Acetobacter pomorum]|nr:hypothetical protein ApDm4_2460 [Acetobacter pomorum]